jgi:hypothetical protein
MSEKQIAFQSLSFTIRVLMNRSEVKSTSIIGTVARWSHVGEQPAPNHESALFIQVHRYTTMPIIPLSTPMPSIVIVWRGRLFQVHRIQGTAHTTMYAHSSNIYATHHASNSKGGLFRWSRGWLFQVHGYKAWLVHRPSTSMPNTRLTSFIEGGRKSNSRSIFTLHRTALTLLSVAFSRSDSFVSCVVDCKR